MTVKSKESNEDKLAYWSSDRVILIFATLVTIMSILLGICTAEKKAATKFKQESARILTMQYSFQAAQANGNITVLNDIPIIYHDELRAMERNYRNKYLTSLDGKEVLFVGKISSIDLVKYDRYFVCFELDNTTFNFDCLFSNTDEHYRQINALSIGDTVCIRGHLDDGLGGALFQRELLYQF